MKHWPMTATIVAKVDGKVLEQVVPNIKDGKFLIAQLYAFNVNEPAGGGSITVIRMEIPAGTPVEDGYKEIRASLIKLKLNPFKVCHELKFYEVIGECSE